MPVNKIPMRQCVLIVRGPRTLHRQQKIIGRCWSIFLQTLFLTVIRDYIVKKTNPIHVMFTRKASCKEKEQFSIVALIFLSSEQLSMDGMRRINRASRNGFWIDSILMKRFRRFRIYS